MRDTAHIDAAGSLRLAAELAGAESVEELVQRLYACIGEVFASTSVGFDLLDPHTGHLESSSAQGVSRFFLTRYDRVARESDPALQQALATRQLAYNLAMMSEDEWRELSVYGDAFALHRMLGVVYVPVLVDGEVVATLNLGRAEGEALFTDDELRVAGELATLLGAGLAVVRRRERSERELELARHALDALQDAVVISDEVRGERYANRAALEILQRRADEERSFDEEVLGALHRRSHHAREGLVRRVVQIDSGRAFLAFLASAPSSERGIAPWLARELTPREAEVVHLVATGLRDGEIARQLNLSPHTIKGYLREVYRKTGTRSRVELTRLAVSEADD